MSKRKRKRKREEAAAAAAAPDGADATDATTDSVEEPLSPRRLLPVDVQQKEFRLAFRGYNEQDVDVFLDGVTEELARLHEENKRLIEQLEEGGGVGPTAGVLIQDAQRRAEDIVREAREQAGALLSGAVEPGSGTAAEDIRPFLVREREFLQGLAGLIQQHAEAVKREAQQVRESSAEATPRPSATYAAGAESDLSGYVPRHASESAPPAPLAAAPEPADAALPATTDATVGGGDAWGPEPQADAWAEAPEAEPAEASLPYVPAATEIPGPSPTTTTEFEQAAPPAETPEPDLGQTQSWRAPPEPEWEEAVELPLEDEGGDRFTPEAPPGQAAQEPAFDPEGGGEASWTNPFLETGGPEPTQPAPAAPQPADLEDDLRPDPISLAVPAPETESEAESEDAGQGAESAGPPRDESDEADREESDRSLRELFWGEE